jgi:hypothetical protein
MKLGLFLMPSHPPEREFKAGQEWDLEMLRIADRLGYDEAWIGEHFTSPWEPNPAPDLLIAQALMQTRRIVLAPGAHLLPYHHRPNSPAGSPSRTIWHKAVICSALVPAACQVIGNSSAWME